MFANEAMKRKLHMLSACILWLLSLSASSSTPQIQQNSNSAVQSLERCLDNAREGDTVFVQSGKYEGNLLISRRIALVGIGRPVIRGSGRGSVITVSADRSTLKGFVIEHSGTMLIQEDAGILLKSSFNTVEGNDLRDVLFGIYLLGSHDNTTTQNTIAGRNQLELGERGSGIHLWNSHRNTFSGNVISDTRDGFYVQNANRTLIADNEVSRVRYGLHYMYADSNVFLRNSFHDNVAGAAVMYSHGIIVRKNIFAHNRGFSSFGILFQDCTGMVVDSNIIADNVVGMFFEGTRKNLFRHNVIAQNDAALEMFQNSTDNIFTENNFIDNLNPMFLIGKRTETQWSLNEKGNYWSNYDGYDLDDDGIGDVPFKIQNVFHYLEGQYPNIRLYLHSPASQALAAASTAFPIMEISQEKDVFPLMRPIEIKGMDELRHRFERRGVSRNVGHSKASLAFVLPILSMLMGGMTLWHLIWRRRP